MNNEIKEDSAMVAHLQPYQKQVHEIMNEVIGFTEEELKKGFPESKLGNLLADIIYVKAGQYSKTKIDFSLINTGGIRVNLAKGNITVGAIFEIMPFENQIVVLTLDGSQVHELFDYMAKRGGIPVSHARYTIYNSGAEDIFIGENPLDITKNYNLAISDYLADGGDDLLFLKNAKSRIDAGVKVRDAMLEFVREQTAEGKKISAVLEGRVKMK
ncbi:MAG: hypothetical protein A3H98_05825 [Bacteroidetes bacterium RIFCSPLOWO2_02_FULL_36_8]|nr:MAG: hypothetical protein A3H98_05825 [Bacteroidetes bacterium RIFCSPLOWO2_02_FULL_36_8]OFY71038.1 MAG: hypothetical protein A3G23_12485 [Bacteroidetes bacterium RIFCSPLOWO2_12_FULL_37_12]